MLERLEKENKIWLLNECWVEFAFQSFWVKIIKEIQEFWGHSLISIMMLVCVCVCVWTGGNMAF